jgi:site-specific recombinase XerC
VSLSPHTLRHCFAYRLLETSGNDLVALADILGHANLNPTRLYTKRRFEDLEAAVEDLRFD